MIVQTFYVLPDRNVQLEVDIVSDGVVLLRYGGVADMPCWCGRSHVYRVHLVLRVSWKAQGNDLADVEALIRGRDDVAQRLSWTLLTKAVSSSPACATVGTAER